MSKHTLSASESIQRPEFRKRKLLRPGAALASLALVGSSFINTTEEIDVHSIPPPGYVLRDSHGEIVSVPPAERTVTLADIAGVSEPYYLNYNVMKDGIPINCQSVDLRLPQRIDYGEVVKGAKTDFALSTEKAQEALREVQQAQTIPEVQKILEQVLEELGMTAQFDAPLDPRYIPYEKGSSTEETFFRYSGGATNFINTLAIMPREMATSVGTINFLNTQRFGGTRGEDGKVRWAGGTYSSGENTIRFAMLGMPQEHIIHEFAHAMHYEACEGRSDEELKREFDDIMGLLRTDIETKELESQFGWDKERTNGDQMGHNRYIRQGKLHGIPTSYSRRSHVELLAELTAQMVCRKGLFSDTVTSIEERESARRVREMVLERLETALQSVDVSAWIQYLTDYNQTLPSVLDPKDAIAHRISPLDSTYAYYKYVVKLGEDMGPNDWKLTPAIAIKSRNGEPDQYIYAYQNLKEGKIDIQISAPQGAEDARDTLAKAADHFIRSTPGYADAEIRVNETGGMTGEVGTGIELIAIKQ